MIKCSIIITTHNRPNELRVSLQSLANQTLNWSLYKIIVIDNYSYDHGVATQKVCKEIKKNYPLLHLEYHHEEVAGGITYSKNKWTQLVDSEIIIFGDDDYIADNLLIESCIECFEDRSIGIVVGPLLPKFETDIPPDWVNNLWETNQFGSHITDFTILDFGAQKKVIPYHFAFWSNLAVRKDVFMESNGFGPDGFAGDKVYYNGNGEHHLNQFVEESGYKIVYCPLMLAKHRIFPYRFSRNYFSSRNFYYGIGDSFNLSRKSHRPLSLFSRMKYAFRMLFNLSYIDKPKPLRFANLWRLHGFLNHQSLLRKNPKFLEFVLLDSWIDYDFTSMPPLKAGPSFMK